MNSNKSCLPLSLSAGMWKPHCSKSSQPKESRKGWGGWRGGARNLGGVYVYMGRVTNQRKWCALSLETIKSAPLLPPLQLSSFKGKTDHLISLQPLTLSSSSFLLDPPILTSYTQSHSLSLCT